MKNDIPCHGCENRYAGCHSECAKYSEWSKEHIRKQREIRSIIEAENAMHTYAIETSKRIKRRRRERNNK
jgi:predicted ATP-binding protein involved in virulence